MSQQRRLPEPIRETLAFYRQRPAILIIALGVAAILLVGVLTDGGIDLGETVAVVAVGAIIGMVYAALRSLRERED